MGESRQNNTSELLGCLHYSKMSFGFGINPNVYIRAIVYFIVLLTDRERHFTKACSDRTRGNGFKPIQF